MRGPFLVENQLSCVVDLKTCCWLCCCVLLMRKSIIHMINRWSKWKMFWGLWARMWDWRELKGDEKDFRKDSREDWSLETAAEDALCLFSAQPDLKSHNRVMCVIVYIAKKLSPFPPLLLSSLWGIHTKFICFACTSKLCHYQKLWHLRRG